MVKVFPRQGLEGVAQGRGQALHTGPECHQAKRPPSPGLGRFPDLGSFQLVLLGASERGSWWGVEPLTTLPSFIHGCSFSSHLSPFHRPALS